jgi:hypothetical protein
VGDRKSLSLRWRERPKERKKGEKFKYFLSALEEWVVYWPIRYLGSGCMFEFIPGESNR